MYVRGERPCAVLARLDADDIAFASEAQTRTRDVAAGKIDCDLDKKRPLEAFLSPPARLVR